MHTHIRQRYELFTRVRDFGTMYGPRFAGAAVAQHAFADVGAAVKALEVDDLAKLSATVVTRIASKTEVRRVLTRYLRKMAHTARALAQTDPTIEHRFRVPSQAGDQALLTLARQFAEHSAPLAAGFISHSLPPTFAADLERLIAAFEAAVRERALSREERVVARTRTAASLNQGLAAVRRLDAIVLNHLGEDPEALAAWTSARRPPRSRKAKRPADDEASPAAPVEPTSLTAASSS